jgi:hypothetical protein
MASKYARYWAGGAILTGVAVAFVILLIYGVYQGGLLT